MKKFISVIVLSFSAALCAAQPELSKEVKEFVNVDSPVVALDHVRVIDGTGAPAKLNQTILISGGKIAAIGDTGSVKVPDDAKHIDFTNFSALPGLVGMHDHLFYPAAGRLYHDMPFSFPRLYLAAGVTTIRTTGSIEPYVDLELKKSIDAGKTPGPKINPTGPYLEGAGTFIGQLHQLTGPDDARRTVDYWTEEGAGSFKAYMFITRAELKAAAEAAHRHHLKITGHLCAVGFREAAELGIDDLEHGLTVDTEFFPGKKPDVCPNPSEAVAATVKLEIESEPIQTTIHELIAHHVALTSTLPVFEQLVFNRPDEPQRVMEMLSEDARKAYQANRARVMQSKDSPWPVMFQHEMQFERAFAKAGGLLLAGLDPTGIGGTIAGFGDWRELELLVDAGFTPLEAIKIASLNGAQFLEEQDKIGSLETGKQADVVIVNGDPSTKIQDIENVVLVFKDGIGYSTKDLMNSVKGQVGIH